MKSNQVIVNNLSRKAIRPGTAFINANSQPATAAPAIVNHLNRRPIHTLRRK